MRNVVRVLLLLFTLLSCFKVDASSPPVERGITATYAVAFRVPLKKGWIYGISGQPIVVSQSVPGGLILQSGSRVSNPLFMLATAKQAADGDYLQPDICGLYTGIYRYQTVLGSTSSIHAFKEVKCPVSSAQKPKAAAPKSWPVGMHYDGLTRIDKIPAGWVIAADDTTPGTFKNPKSSFIYYVRPDSIKREADTGYDVVYKAQFSVITKQYGADNPMSKKHPGIKVPFIVMFDPVEATLNCSQVTMDGTRIKTDEPARVKMWNHVCLPR